MENSGYVVTAGLIETDARGALGMLRRMKITEVYAKKDIKKAVREVLGPAKREVMQAAKAAMPNDPRMAYRGVKMGIYGGRKAFGGNISLLNQKGGRSMTLWRPAKGGASGITRKRSRSERTNRIDSYYGKDRAFILRMQNTGTGSREAFTRTKSKNGKTANRGVLPGKNFFARSSEAAVEKAAETLAKKVEKMIMEANNNK